MTYLDPAARVRNRTDWRTWLVRTVTMGALIVFGWFVITLGMEDNGGTRIVSEPVASDPVVAAPVPAGN